MKIPRPPFLRYFFSLSTNGRKFSRTFRFFQIKLFGSENYDQIKKLLNYRTFSEVIIVGALFLLIFILTLSFKIKSKNKNRNSLLATFILNLMRVLSPFSHKLKIKEEDIKRGAHLRSLCED